MDGEEAARQAGRQAGWLAGKGSAGGSQRGTEAGQRKRGERPSGLKSSIARIFAVTSRKSCDRPLRVLHIHPLPRLQHTPLSPCFRATVRLRLYPSSFILRLQKRLVTYICGLPPSCALPPRYLIPYFLCQYSLSSFRFDLHISCIIYFVYVVPQIYRIIYVKIRRIIGDTFQVFREFLECLSR